MKKRIKIEDKLILKEFILEIQGNFTVSMLLDEIEMERRSLVRVINNLIEDGYLTKVSGWNYRVNIDSSDWKIN